MVIYLYSSCYYYITPSEFFPPAKADGLLASLLKSRGLLSVFWPILTMLSSRWSLFVFRIPALPASFYIIIIILLIWEFFPPALSDGFPLESEWQLVSSNLRVFSQYYIWSLEKKKLCKISIYCFEKIMEAALQKGAAVWPLTSHLKNHTSMTKNTCWTLLRSKNEHISDFLSSILKQGRNYRGDQLGLTYSSSVWTLDAV